jgi:hypothetical protein
MCRPFLFLHPIDACGHRKRYQTQPTAAPFLSNCQFA